MKMIFAILGSIVTLLPMIVDAIPSGPPTPKTNVTGVVVDFERHDCVVMLKNFKGWDRKQTEIPWVVKTATWKWIKSFGPGYAAIFVKKEDLKKIRKGQRLTIDGYSYFYDERMMFASYDKLTVEKIKRAEQPMDVNRP